ncbi:hypothetical protein J2Z44_002700 [Clostridium punense]|uniref:DUF2933 domain-containing protein n=1 Tax=Clostridium punense TaxID=1054297 RepID=A0ABS4K6G5_9CLOT|nr:MULTISPECIES: hypothetical protein [Clostridium]EQB86142.1 hypothetical protein M918_15615 [Clostridium sp. BL8]MBP2022875.1 hypothetical protein [Clostridium punense]
MKCHGDNNETNKKHSPIKHMLMMVLCCGLPFLIIGAIPLLNIGGGFKALLLTISPFICPIMMLFMIPMMFKSMKGGSCCSGKEGESKEINKA